MATSPASKKMKSTEIKSIPQELIVEIFSWLPIKSLMRYRCSSKFYNSLVFESNFMDIHHRHSMIRPGGRKYLVYKKDVFYTVQPKEDGKASLLRIENIDQFSYYCPTFESHLMCVHGLVCSWQDLHHIAICNFNTRQVRFLQCPEEYVNINNYSCNRVCSIGFEPQEKKYKLWLTLFSSKGNTTINWVFTLFMDKSWRKINWNVARSALSLKRICVSGVIYILCYEDYNSPLKIIAFDVRSETFRILTSLPHTSTLHGYIHYNLIEIKGKLAVLKYNMYSSKNMHLWVLGNAQNDDWECHLIRYPSQWNDIDVGPESYFRFLCTSCDEEIVLESCKKSRDFIYMCYDVSRKNWRQFEEIENAGERYWFDKTLCYVENLFSLRKHCGTNLQD